MPESRTPQGRPAELGHTSCPVVRPKRAAAMEAVVWEKKLMAVAPATKWGDAHALQIVEVRAYGFSGRPGEVFDRLAPILLVSRKTLHPHSPIVPGFGTRAPRGFGTGLVQPGRWVLSGTRRMSHG
jgi:hypothetical protein